jgi:glutaredoxin
MKIELLYIMNCPWCVKTKESLREVLKELKLKAKVKEILIDTRVKAKKYKFVGSPTIRINNKDIQEGIEKARCLPCEKLAKSTKKTTSFVKKECCMSGCRSYNYKGKQYPYPPKRMIKEALNRF